MFKKLFTKKVKNDATVEYNTIQCVGKFIEEGAAEKEEVIIIGQ